MNKEFKNIEEHTEVVDNIKNYIFNKYKISPGINYIIKDTNYNNIKLKDIFYDKLIDESEYPKINEKMMFKCEGEWSNCIIWRKDKEGRIDNFVFYFSKPNELGEITFEQKCSQIDNYFSNLKLEKDQDWAKKSIDKLKQKIIQIEKDYDLNCN
jgi:hypothetical protein